MAEKAEKALQQNVIEFHDFIELDYTGSMADGTVFDTTSKEIAEKHHLAQENQSFSPVKICVGEKQLLPGLEEQLVGKETGKEYIVRLPPEKAFGKRDVRMLRVIPLATFMEHKTEPHPGMQVNVDGKLGIVSSISGGRVIVNFNHPLAGKDVSYTFTILRIITDLEEKIVSYLQRTLQFPEKSVTVSLSEGKAAVELPMALPVDVVEVLAGKLRELVNVEVHFEQKTAV